MQLLFTSFDKYGIIAIQVKSFKQTFAVFVLECKSDNCRDFISHCLPSVGFVLGTVFTRYTNCHAIVFECTNFKAFRTPNDII